MHRALPRFTLYAWVFPIAARADACFGGACARMAFWIRGCHLCLPYLETAWPASFLFTVDAWHEIPRRRFIGFFICVLHMSVHRSLCVASHRNIVYDIGLMAAATLFVGRALAVVKVCAATCHLSAHCATLCGQWVFMHGSCVELRSSLPCALPPWTANGEVRRTNHH